jgi:hypothetical protein
MRRPPQCEIGPARGYSCFGTADLKVRRPQTSVLAMQKKTDPGSRSRRRSKSSEWNPEIIDDWPDEIPVSVAELELYELYLGDKLDQIFGLGNRPSPSDSHEGGGS